MNTRPPNRDPMPDLDRLLQEANELLAEAGLPLCQPLQAVDDPDTANPTVLGLAGETRYVIKVCTRYPDTQVTQARLANEVARVTGLPIPRHYAAPQAEDRLPLLIMQWMPGEQLRLLLPALEADAAGALAQDWGRCVGTFHQADIDDAPPSDDPAASGQGLHRRMQHDLDELLDRHAVSETQAKAVRVWLQSRAAAVQRPVLAGVTKSDLDVRDFLGLAQPRPHISAMLDWESVRPGECLWNLASICIRLHLMNLERLWPDFLLGYDSAGTFRWRQSAASEYYLAARIIIASATGQLIALRLLDSLLVGLEWAFPGE